MKRPVYFPVITQLFYDDFLTFKECRTLSDVRIFRGPQRDISCIISIRWLKKWTCAMNSETLIRELLFY
jgi:hypothetical protein